MQTLIIRQVANLQQSLNSLVNRFNFKVLPGEQERIILLPPEGDGKVLFCLEESMYNRNDKKALIEFRAETQEEFDKHLAFFESKGMVVDFQDYLSYSEMGVAMLQGPEGEVFVLSRVD